MARPSPRGSDNHEDMEVLFPVGETSACFFLFICQKSCVSLNWICTPPPPGPDYKMVGLCFSQIGFERLLKIPLTSLKRP